MNTDIILFCFLTLIAADATSDEEVAVGSHEFPLSEPDYPAMKPRPPSIELPQLDKFDDEQPSSNTNKLATKPSLRKYEKGMLRMQPKSLYQQKKYPEKLQGTFHMAKWGNEDEMFGEHEYRPSHTGLSAVKEVVLARFNRKNQEPKCTVQQCRAEKANSMSNLFEQSLNEVSKGCYQTFFAINDQCKGSEREPMVVACILCCDCREMPHRINGLATL